MKIQIRNFTITPTEACVEYLVVGTLMCERIMIPLPAQPLTEEEFVVLVKLRQEQAALATERFAWLMETQYIEIEVGE